MATEHANPVIEVVDSNKKYVGTLGRLSKYTDRGQHEGRDNCGELFPQFDRPAKI